MAGIDAEVAAAFHKCIVPFLVILIGLRIIWSMFAKLYPFVFAFVISRFSKKHHKVIKKEKERLLSEVADLGNEHQRFLALEIGAGPGRNFAIYPLNTSLIIVEPCTKFQPQIEENAAKFPKLEVTKVLAIDAADLREHVEDNSQDLVMCSFTLCSVRDPEAVVAEVRRVLKPGGRFYFMEHTSPFEKKSWLHILHFILSPLIHFVANCHFRTTWVTIDRAGFSKVQYTKKNVATINWFARPHIFGYAVK